MLVALGTTGTNQGEEKQAKCLSAGLFSWRDNPQRKEGCCLLRVF